LLSSAIKFSIYKLERLTAPSASLKVEISFISWHKPMHCDGLNNEGASWVRDLTIFLKLFGP